MWSNKEADFFPEINKSFTFPGMGLLIKFFTSIQAIHFYHLNGEWMLGAFTLVVWLVSISYTMAGSISNYNMFLETVLLFLIMLCVNMCHY